MPADKFLPAIGHAVSGAAGTAISTTTTYPLDLVNTRLKVQRSLSTTQRYEGLSDAFAKIWEREGGLQAFYVGLGSDVAKSVADSFLFFLFYTWFHSRRSRANSRRLPAWEELAVGAAAGACARLFTTPISNVVTRKQTASLLADHRDITQSQQGAPTDPSFAEVLHVIRAEKGFLGLWSGYSATLVLTLNPSITFYLQNALKKALVDRGRGGESGGMVFLIAAMSKVVATAITYPFNIAKARIQVSATHSPTPGSPSKEIQDECLDADTRDGSPVNQIKKRVQSLAGNNIFASVLSIQKEEGVSTLYDGLSGELLKAFFNHGTTMLSKDIAHKLIVRLYFIFLAFLKTSPITQALLAKLSGRSIKAPLRDKVVARYQEIKDAVLRGALILHLVDWARKQAVVSR
ncbi:mitochondrial carrier domain-containing protein [Coniella lustricola]|uniref:Mitochondrial carrier domain-containing protein n=1 Tax=Coniella lustricola TaxID=2025994 RepID=A0A2T3ABC3_9PEZI|nr:mitochondrial carrier domain-containing protein [Coniella lustricola]